MQNLKHWCCELAVLSNVVAYLANTRCSRYSNKKDI